MELTRREALAGGAAALASSGLPVRAAPGSASLESLARQSGRRFGSAVSWSPSRADRGSFANPAYAQILERECELLVEGGEVVGGEERGEVADAA